MPANRNILVSVIFRVLVVSVLLGSAIGVYLLLANSKPQPQAAEPDSVVPRVPVMAARPVAVHRQWEGFGTAAAMQAADVPARVTATVLERPENIRAGMPVKQGQLLVRLDDTEFVRQVEIASQAIEDLTAQIQRLDVEQQSWTQRLEIAREEAALARGEVDRLEKAYARDAARQREVDQARQALLIARRNEVAISEEVQKIAPRRASLYAQRQSQEAALRLARLNVERSRIMSPLDGRLQSVDVEVGENLMIGQRVARIVNLDRIEVPLLLPAMARRFIQIGDSAELFSNGEEWAAQVARISPEDDQATRTMRVYTEIAAPAQRSTATPPPGKFLRGMVTSGHADNRWIVPRRALSGERLLLIEDGVVRSRAVEVDFQLRGEFAELGLPDTQWVALQQALPLNTLVVVDGSRDLVEGARAIAVLPDQSRAVAGPIEGNSP